MDPFDDWEVPDLRRSQMQVLGFVVGSYLAVAAAAYAVTLRAYRRFVR